MRNAEFPITWARNKKSEKSRYRIFGLYATLSCCQVFLRPTEIRKTLDCPCHGSRYGIDGYVVNEHAMSPLDPAD